LRLALLPRQPLMHALVLHALGLCHSPMQLPDVCASMSNPCRWPPAVPADALSINKCMHGTTVSGNMPCKPSPGLAAVHGCNTTQGLVPCNTLLRLQVCLGGTHLRGTPCHAHCTLLLGARRDWVEGSLRVDPATDMNLFKTSISHTAWL
jgi:hypothetical protein